ncbi:MAG: FTR1 family iron permease [Gemmatimonadaceae bacterium]
MPPSQSTSAPPAIRSALYAVLGLGALAVVAILIWQGVAGAGNPTPDAPNTSAAVAVLDIGVLTFREGLECVLVLSAITASMTGAAGEFRKPIAWGAGVAFMATIATWFAVIGLLGALSENVSALHIQAATGLVAIIVLLIVMNWFFHKIYWTGWIGLHTRKKQGLVKSAANPETSRSKVFMGLALLGFTSLYREGFEVVLFLQSYRLRLGSGVVLDGVSIGLVLTCIVAVLAFVAHQRLPYKKMLVFTGVMLGAVLLVMVGEEAQEMQLAHWLPTTTIHAVPQLFPPWAGLWFSVFPTVETISAQVLAAGLVLASFFMARGVKVQK